MNKIIRILLFYVPLRASQQEQHQQKRSKGQQGRRRYQSTTSCTSSLAINNCGCGVYRVKAATALPRRRVPFIPRAGQQTAGTYRSCFAPPARPTPPHAKHTTQIIESSGNLTRTNASRDAAEAAAALCTHAPNILGRCPIPQRPITQNHSPGSPRFLHTRRRHTNWKIDPLDIIFKALESLANLHPLK